MDYQKEDMGDLPYQYQVQVGERKVFRGCVSCKNARKVGKLGNLPVAFGREPKSTGLCGASDRIVLVTVTPTWYGAYQGRECPKWKPQE
jgi:hypothetical protein